MKNPLTIKIEEHLGTEYNELYTFGDLSEAFPKESLSVLEGIYYRYKKKLKLSESKESLLEVTKVRIEDIEPLIAKELTKGYDQQVIRLALDLVKLKQIDKGIDDDLDVSAYIKKAQEVLGNIE